MPWGISDSYDAMRKTGILVWCLLSAVLAARADESTTILKRIDAFRMPYDQFLIRVKITSFEEARIKETALFDAYINGNEKSLVIAKKYKTKGLKILYVNENMWIHMPNTHRPLRITPIQRLMGEASNGDVARVGYGDDYTAEYKGEEGVGGVPCQEILLTARKKSATYHKILLYAQRSDFRPVKARFYLLSGKHFKTAIYEHFEPVGGKVILKRMTIYDAIQKGLKTTFEYVLIKEREIPAKYFNKNYLIHVRELD